MFLQLIPVKALTMLSVCLLFSTETFAQVIPDGSTSTTVTSEGSRNIIQDGQTAGTNLFHSFSDFSLPNGGEAFFDNASNVENIISRVTGGRISDINGLISANGSANLFLVNPAGIVFNNGASLNIGGSFYGSTADSILFPEGVEFSASNPVEPVLTINAPIGLNFRENPAPISIQGADLRVRAGQTLTLLGGNIDVTDSNLTARDGQILIGGLADSGTIDLNSDLEVNFADELNFAEVSLSDRTFISVSGDGSGAIAIQGNNINLVNNSVINGGIDPEQSAVGVTPGNIELIATETISLEGNSVIRNNVTTNSTGNAGNIQLNAANMFLDGSRVSSTIQGQGDTGGVVIEVGESLTLTGSEVNSRVVETGVGNAGNLEIIAGSLALDNSAIFSQTLGDGDAGGLSLNIADSITAINNSFFQSQVSPGATGNSNDVTINTGSLALDSTQILSDSNGIGNAGDISINAEGDVSLNNDSIIISKVSQGEGDAGDITINSARLLLDGRSFLISNTGDIDPTLNNTGNAGNIIVNSSAVDLNNFSQITSNSLSNAVGQPGDVEVNTDTLTIIGGSNINALTENASDGGTVSIKAQNIELSTGGKIVTGTNGTGNGGSIVLDVAENIDLNGDNPPTQPEPFIEEILQNLELETGLFANATIDATGNGGSIQVNSPGEVNIFNSATISVASEGTGNGGSLLLQAEELTLDNQGIIEAFTANGSGGNVELQIADLIFMQNNNNLISAQALNNANGGNLSIDTTFVVALPNQNNDILANASTGNGGNISITAESLLGIEERASQPANSTNDIDASSEFGLDGEVSIFTPDVDQARGATELDGRVIEPQATIARACSAQQTEVGTSSLNIRGKGGIPLQPVEPFITDTILARGDDNRAEQLPQVEQHHGVLTAQGYIYPARSIAVKDDGEIMLVSHSSLLTQRNIIKSRNCH
ncbi:MAG: filamentous hemagglutinin N-terminal domain-containing protein [Cyanobacteria bacterium P01_E01_bin.35]